MPVCVCVWVCMPVCVCVCVCVCVHVCVPASMAGLRLDHSTSVASVSYGVSYGITAVPLIPDTVPSSEGAV